MSRTIAMIVYWGLCASAANAQGLVFATDPNAPIDIKAAVIDLRDAKNRADFSGDAEFAQGPLRFEATAMQLTLNPDGTASKLTAQGRVTLLSDAKRDGISRRATADIAVYHPQRQELWMRGNVQVTQSGARESLLRGGELRIDLTNGRAALSGGGPKNQPKQNEKPRARIELR